MIEEEYHSEGPKWDYSSPCANCLHPAWLGDKRAIDSHNAWHTGDGECQGPSRKPGLLAYLFMKCGCPGYKPSLIIGPKVWIDCNICKGTGKVWTRPSITPVDNTLI
jgi:hypothetical protein